MFHVVSVFAGTEDVVRVPVFVQFWVRIRMKSATFVLGTFYMGLCRTRPGRRTPVSVLCHRGTSSVSTSGAMPGRVGRAWRSRTNPGRTRGRHGMAHGRRVAGRVTESGFLCVGGGIFCFRYGWPMPRVSEPLFSRYGVRMDGHAPRRPRAAGRRYVGRYRTVLAGVPRGFLMAVLLVSEKPFPGDARGPGRRAGLRAGLTGLSPAGSGTGLGPVHCVPVPVLAGRI